jgi:hypothetical protein
MPDNAGPTWDHAAAQGLALGAAVGWQYDRARDWSLGIELEDQVLVLDRAGGVRHALAGLMDVKLDL